MVLLTYKNYGVDIHPVVAGIGLWALYLALRTLIDTLSQYRRARQLGCKPARVRVGRWITGIDAPMQLISAGKEYRVPDKFVEMTAKNGCDTSRDWLFGRMTHFTVNPRNIQALLATQFHDFEIGEIRRNAFIPMLGRGIFTADGKYWEHSRALLRPQFAREQVADLDLEENHVQHLMAHLKPSLPGQWTDVVDLGPLFFRLTIDSATEFLFGESVGSQLQALQSGNSDAKLGGVVDSAANVARSFDSAMGAIGIRSRIMQFSWMYNPREFRDSCKNVHQFADSLVHRALERYRQNLASTNDEKTRYVFLDELVKATQDPIELRCQLLHILLAGRDTTAGLLGWACYSLARHPQVYQKLRGIILDNFGTYDKPHDISFHTLKSCTYLQHVLNETLRLFPSVPLNARQAVKDTTLPCGGGPDGQSPIFIPKGTGVGYAVYVMHRRKDLWGPDAEKFVPERWTNWRPGWEYLPFNGGPRICLGQQFALTEAGYVLTRLVQRFETLQDADVPDVPIQHQYSVTSAPRQVLVKLREA